MEHAKQGWIEEKRSAYLYAALSRHEPNPQLAQLFAKLGHRAEAQAAIWAKKAEETGMALATYRPDLRARLVAWLLSKIEPRRLKPMLAAMKVRGLSAYSRSIPNHPMPTDLEQVGQRHRGVGMAGNLRAAVFGINDGLVSNASLILGVAGASDNSAFILLSGMAGLLAGACSMGAGEYISVRSQREMFQHQIDLEKKELQQYPEEEAEELALIYEAKGLSLGEARSLAHRIIANPNRALDTLAREELGLNLDELGSPWSAAISSFISFSIGASIPLLPFLWAAAESSLWISLVCTGLGLFTTGATLSLFTGRRAWWSGIRMLLIGGGAGAVTFLIGKWLGVKLGA
ncbi:MAG TPA: VIT1/CCC1 transporter family protein [bacterium]|nr:VIT1/CCC1 transporter family protein [bacterium]